MAVVLTTLACTRACRRNRAAQAAVAQLLCPWESAGLIKMHAARPGDDETAGGGGGSEDGPSFQHHWAASG